MKADVYIIRVILTCRLLTNWHLNRKFVLIKYVIITSLYFFSFSRLVFSSSISSASEARRMDKISK